MRRAQRLVVMSTAVVLSGCINWDNADLSWCNIADLENRHAVCGLGDGTVSGPAPAIAEPRIFSAPGNQRFTALLSVGSTVFVAGEYDTELRFGGAFRSNGGKDGFVTRLDAQGNPAQTVTFGGVGDEQVLRLREGPGASVLVAGRFSGTSTAPGGTSLSSDGVGDSYVALLDGGLAAVRIRDFGATPGSRVELMDASWSNGAIVVAGRVEGTMNVDGVVIGQSGLAQAFVLVLDEALGYQWHAASRNCGDGYGDSAIAGPEGEVYWAVRIRGAGGNGEVCELGAQAFLGGFWLDGLLRLDRVNGQVENRWTEGLFDSARNPFQWKGKLQPGYEAPHQVEFRDGAVVWLRHPPAAVPSRDPYARLDFLSPNDAAPLREHRQAGSLVSDGDIRARFATTEGSVWMFGNFSSDSLVFGGTNQKLGPIRQGQHGFVRRFGDDETGDWARAFMGSVAPRGTHISGVHTDAQRRVWIAGSFHNEVVTSELWLEGDAQDLMIFVTEPQP